MYTLVLLLGHNLWQATLRHAHDGCLPSYCCVHFSTCTADQLEPQEQQS